MQLKIFSFCILTTLIFSCCSEERTISQMELENANKRLEKAIQKIPNYDELSEYSFDKSIKLLKSGINKKGFVWMKISSYNFDLYPILNGYRCSFRYKKEKSTISLTIPKHLESEDILALQIIDDLNKKKSPQYKIEVDVENRIFKISP